MNKIQQPSLKLFLRKDKSYLFRNGTDVYYYKLRSALLDIKNDNKSEYLLASFFILSTTTLEFSLNLMLVDYCVNLFGCKNYKNYADGFIGISLANKYISAPSIISNGRLIVDKTNRHSQVLLSAISLRNKIIHNKEFLTEFGPIDLGECEEPKSFDIGMISNPINEPNKSMCLDIGEALGAFRSCIMTPALLGELKANEMLLETSSNVPDNREAACVQLFRCTDPEHPTNTQQQPVG